MGELAEVFDIDDYTDFDDGDGGDPPDECDDCGSTNWNLYGQDEFTVKFHICCANCGSMLAGHFPQVED